ncbi:hypothetical protein P154DRAFT_209638 [Amniculicola lignicola CBS 123094]|uniref:Uncharacterized protein n=1 Tax=Amniculicola lignicola CBS 123094 TaxID=1392246 RepID=A0A6A5WGS7_9PLEO|nr:hypothetical protein P154DRAFT_209638 [Amniculicola lignicola CBS 123094]
MLGNPRTSTLSSSRAPPMHPASSASLIERPITLFPTRTTYCLSNLYTHGFSIREISASAIRPTPSPRPQPFSPASRSSPPMVTSSRQNTSLAYGWQRVCERRRGWDDARACLTLPALWSQASPLWDTSCTFISHIWNLRKAKRYAYWSLAMLQRVVCRAFSNS